MENTKVTMRGYTFLVIDRTKGGESNELGWAYITISEMRLIDIGYIRDNTEISLDKFELNVTISDKNLEMIEIMFKQGFRSTYSYNFAQYNTYLKQAKIYVKSLKNE